jgi:proline iminopeptidase
VSPPAPSPSHRYVELNGVRFWTARHGSGPPLVLLHGGPGGWDSFDELAAMVDDLVEVHRYEQRGSGRSSEAPPYTVESFIADLDALRAHWGHDRWIVAGHSAGATLALAYAVEHRERVAAAVCVSGGGVIDAWSQEHHSEQYRVNRTARWTPEQRERRAALQALLRDSPDAWTDELEREYTMFQWIVDVAGPGRAAEVARRVDRPHRAAHDVNAAMNEAWRRRQADGGFAERLRRLDLPVLIVHGAADPRPQLLAERLAAMLKQSRLVVIPDAGHWPWLENPEPTRAALRAFLLE